MLASQFGSPVFDAHGIMEAPGHNPYGKSGQSVGMGVIASPETAQSLVAKGKRGQFRGARTSKFIQDLQFVPKKFDPTLGTPLSKPDGDGNEIDTALALKPPYADPINGTLTDVLARVNTRESVEDFVGALTAADIDKRLKGHIKMETDNRRAENVVRDYIEAQAQQRKNDTIEKLMEQGFTKDEAVKAYEEARKDDAKAAIKGKDVVGVTALAPSTPKRIIKALVGSPFTSPSGSAFRPIAPTSPPPAAPLPPARSKSTGGRPKSALPDITLEPGVMVQKLRDAGFAVSPTLYGGAGRGRKGNSGVRMTASELTMGSMEDTKRRASDLVVKHMLTS